MYTLFPCFATGNSFFSQGFSKYGPIIRNEQPRCKSIRGIGDFALPPQGSVSAPDHARQRAGTIPFYAQRDTGNLPFCD